MIISKGSARQIIGAAVLSLVLGGQSAQASCVAKRAAYAKIFNATAKSVVVVTRDGYKFVKACWFERAKAFAARHYIVRFYTKNGKEIRGAKLKLALKKLFAKEIKAVKKEANAEVKDVNAQAKAAKKDSDSAVEKLAIKKDAQQEVDAINDARDMTIEDLEAQNVRALVAEVQDYLA